MTEMSFMKFRTGNCCKTYTNSFGSYRCHIKLYFTQSVNRIYRTSEIIRYAKSLMRANILGSVAIYKFYFTHSLTRLIFNEN